MIIPSGDTVIKDVGKKMFQRYYTSRAVFFFFFKQKQKEQTKTKIVP